MSEIPLRERRSLAEQWEEFACAAVPAGAGPGQRQMMRAAWYAGAAAMFSAVTDLDSDSDPTDLDLAHVERLQQELTTTLLEIRAQL